MQARGASVFTQFRVSLKRFRVLIYNLIGTRKKFLLEPVENKKEINLIIDFFNRIYSNFNLNLYLRVKINYRI